MKLSNGCELTRNEDRWLLTEPGGTRTITFFPAITRWMVPEMRRARRLKRKEALAWILAESVRSTVTPPPPGPDGDGPAPTLVQVGADPDLDEALGLAGRIR